MPVDDPSGRLDRIRGGEGCHGHSPRICHVVGRPGRIRVRRPRGQRRFPSPGPRRHRKAGVDAMPGRSMHRLSERILSREGSSAAAERRDVSASRKHRGHADRRDRRRREAAIGGERLDSIRNPDGLYRRPGDRGGDAYRQIGSRRDVGRSRPDGLATSRRDGRGRRSARRGGNRACDRPVPASGATVLRKKIRRARKPSRSRPA